MNDAVKNDLPLKNCEQPVKNECRRIECVLTTIELRTNRKELKVFG